VMGWRCEPLGEPVVIDRTKLAALRIEIDPETPALLAGTGIYTPGVIAARPAREAA